ncbi:surfactin synthetase A, putative [Babesia ovata]|uniref:Surfactin synthetase A, putative n=1 Tax=Babesia ovata TaxID=189622 RepID=A0A2H6K6W6_9APIC|nr:surfactin synthetase A, putative [Babesia ovata]GBE58747.1 surfactin synthetase A, putative [Babesia ovata]
MKATSHPLGVERRPARAGHLNSPRRGTTALREHASFPSDVFSALWRRSDRAARDDISPTALRSKSAASRQIVPKWNGWRYKHDSDGASESSGSCQEAHTTSTYTTALYNKLSSMFYEFKGYMYSNWQMYSAAANDRPSASGQIEPCNPTSKRFMWTMDSLVGNKGNADPFVAFIPSFSTLKPGYEFSDAFVPHHDHFVDCFALFIEGSASPGNTTEPLRRTESNTSVESMGDNLICELVNKVSQEVISESGPYQCVFEEEIDSRTPNDGLRNLMSELPISSGRIKFFQTIKSLGKTWENRHRRQGSPVSRASDPGPVECSSPASYIKNRLGVLSEYLARRSEGALSAASLKSYFGNLRARRSADSGDSSASDENARNRLEEHIQIHTGHWDEFQYDDIEVILRDDDNNSVVQLPYGCVIM